MYEAYGMSECSTFISGSARPRPAPPGTLGYPQPGRRVAILDADGPVPLGADGTLAVHRRDPGLMLGYLGAPDGDARREFQGEWFLTGDQGSMARGWRDHLPWPRRRHDERRRLPGLADRGRGRR